jgi:hypothetical protein
MYDADTKYQVIQSWCCHRRWHVGILRVARFLAFLLQTMGWSYVVGEYMIHICRN